MLRLTVVSWNVDSRGGGLSERIQRVGEFAADVALLQEVPRRAEALLENAPGFAWARMATQYSEPNVRSPSRLSTVILGSARLQLHEVGQVPANRFIAAGAAAGLSEFEVRNRTGWLHRNLYVDAEIGGHMVRLVSLHARPATGGQPGRPPLGYARQLFHRVCADWLSEHDGTTVFGVDANAPYVDHPDPEHWQSAMAGDATLVGPHPQHHLTDALYRWLEQHPTDLNRLRAERPNGPLAISYRTNSGRPCRYDHLFISDDLTVEAIAYHPPRQHGSDHGALTATLSL